MKTIRLLAILFLAALTAAAQSTKMRSVTSLPGTCSPGTGVLPTDITAYIPGAGNSLYQQCWGTNSWGFWTQTAQVGIDGISSPGAFQFWPGSGTQPFSTMLNVVQHPTTNPSTNVGSAPLVAQQISDPNADSTSNYYTAAAFYNSVPATNTHNFAFMSGAFFEVRARGSGTIGSAGNTGIYGVDSEVFPDGSTNVGAGGARGVYGHFGNLSSGTITYGAGGEFLCENLAAGIVSTCHGLLVDQPSGTIAAYNALSLGCVVSGSITTQFCINETGAAPNNLGGGATTGGQFILNLTGGGTASNPMLMVHNQASHHGGIFDANQGGQGVMAFSMNDTLGMELDFSWGLYLLDGNAIGFSATTTSLSKDTSLARKSAGVISVGQAASTNDTSGGLAVSRMIAGSLTPTCTFTSGGGTSPSCSLSTGSTDAAGIIIATTGTGSPGGTGTITLTFSTGTTFAAHKAACVYMASDGGTAWNGLAVMKDNTPSTTNDLFTWTNGTTPTTLTASSAYWINYHCWSI